MERTQISQTYQGLSGSTIKVIALVTMFIDHFGAKVMGFITNDIFNFYGLYEGKLPAYYFEVEKKLIVIRDSCRMIGRISFPLFCFLLVEGFIYTRNRKRYAMRLFIFALISELPFDFTFHAYIDNPAWPFASGCNIFFTLFIGFIAMTVIEYLNKDSLIESKLKKSIRFLLLFISIFILTSLADKIKSDYGSYGIFMIIILYCFRKNRKLQVLATCLYMILYTPLGQPFRPLYIISLLCMLLYNGQKGKIRLKYFFYAFYPLHLIFLTLCTFVISSIYKVPYQQSYVTGKSICFYLNEKVYCTLNPDIENEIIKDRNWLDTHIVIYNAKGPSWIKAKVVTTKGELIAETVVMPEVESEPLAIPHQFGGYHIDVTSGEAGEYILRVHEVYLKEENL